ncbi:bacteriophage antitermination protein Q, partial [Salmonella enterica]|uniref:bacteriophage antitermination protein Q n=1 Tax=Salmonella enterica TaxID=28901 RepID=UPI001E3C87E3
MNTQYLEYVRQQLIVATADLSGATKGQLQAWLENAQLYTKNYPRKKQRIRDEVTGKMITLNNPPIAGKQSLAKGSAIRHCCKVSDEAAFCLIQRPYISKT